MIIYNNKPFWVVENWLVPKEFGFTKELTS